MPRDPNPQPWQNRVKSSIRPVVVRGDICIVPLSDGSEAIVDAADFDIVNGWNWQGKNNKSGAVYAYGRRHRPLHRFLAPPGVGPVDHADGDTLNNRRANLRRATWAENARNRAICSNNKAGFKGVHFNKHRNRWVSVIRVDGKLHRKHWRTIEEAARDYDRAALAAFGDFARLNFPRASVGGG